MSCQHHNFVIKKKNLSHYSYGSTNKEQISLLSGTQQCFAGDAIASQLTSKVCARQNASSVRMIGTPHGYIYVAIAQSGSVLTDGHSHMRVSEVTT